MKYVTIDELKEMLKDGAAPEEIIYNSYKYLKTDRENDYKNELTGHYLSTKYYEDHCLTFDNDNIYIIQPEILDSKEKEYLRNVIKPFRNEIDYIQKETDYLRDEHYLSIYFKNEDTMDFKSFELGKMYKGMELNKKYTVEELGL